MTTSSFLNMYSWYIDAVISLFCELFLLLRSVLYERKNAVTVWISMCEETSFAVFYEESIDGWQNETYFKIPD